MPHDSAQDKYFTRYLNFLTNFVGAAATIGVRDHKPNKKKEKVGIIVLMTESNPEISGLCEVKWLLLALAFLSNHPIVIKSSIPQTVTKLQLVSGGQCRRSKAIRAEVVA
mmetsp:Transcript_8034/g.24150  ORF Transcript_8034/g.24150 Transcript_8034/m.24150 type:complete len:110 (+) Transcript_8034:237-566(+)